MDLLAAALAYARSGWYVFPVEARGKAPIGSLVPNGKDDASCDEHTIRAWWHRVPDANIGIATARSGLVVLDVDVADGKLGRTSLAALDANLDATPTVRTGSGGLHAYYARPHDVDPFTRIGVRPGIDIIGHGYVVAPPSIHATGGSYEWTSTPAIAQLPLILRDLRKEIAPITTTEIGKQPIVEGGRNNALFKLGAALRATGIDRDALRAALHLENRRRFSPPLDDAEVEAVATSVMHRVQPQRDVALGAIVSDDVRDLFADDQPEQPAMYVRDVAAQPRKAMRFYSTGNRQLDELLGGGLASSHICGVVGPPSVGKSAYVNELCLHIQTQIPVLHVSTELTRNELMVRYASMRKRFPWRDAMKGKHDDQLAGAVDDLNVKLIGSDTLDRVDPLAMIVRQAITLRIEQNSAPPLIVVDYVQLLARGAEDGMRSRVGELTMKLRILAQSLDCPLIAVFSTGRGFYGNGKLEALRQANDPTAYLSAAKESGDIEFDCATIIFLDVDQLAEGLPKPARGVVARCRVGDIGFAGYRAHLDIGRWEPDPLAVVEMQTNERAAQKREKDLLGKSDDFVRIASEHEGVAWSELRDFHLKSLGGHAIMEVLRDQLVQAGRIAYGWGLTKDTARKAMLVTVLKNSAAPLGVAPHKE